MTRPSSSTTTTISAAPRLPRFCRPPVVDARRARERAGAAIALVERGEDVRARVLPGLLLGLLGELEAPQTPRLVEQRLVARDRAVEVAEERRLELRRDDEIGHEAHYQDREEVPGDHLRPHRLSPG